MALAGTNLLPPGTSIVVARTSRPAWPGWKFACLVAGLTVLLCGFLSFLLPDLLGLNQWLVPMDTWWTVIGAQWVSHGAVGTVYYGDPMYLPLPGMLLMLAPLTALGDHLGLVTGYPIPMARPGMWAAVAPAFFIFGSTSILGVDYLAATLGIARARRRLLAIAIGLVVVPPTCVWAGHPEDLLALAFGSVSLGLLIQGRYRGAGMLMSVAVLMQPWAALLIPVLVGYTPSPWRRRVILWAVALPGTCAALLFALDPVDTFRALGMQPMLGSGQKLPWWSLTHPMSIPMETTSIAARVGSLSRSGAFVVAFLVGLSVARRPSPRILIAAAATALLARGVFETQFWPWYVAPAAVFLALGAASATYKRWIAGGIAAFVVYGFAAASYDGRSMPGWIALLVLVASGTVAVSAPFSLRTERRRRESDCPVSFDEADGRLAGTLDSVDGAVNYAAWIHEMASPYLGSRVLEVGAGHGTLTELLADDGRTVVASELSDRCVGILAERFSTNPQVRVARGDIENARSCGTFDTAVLVNVLEHIEDDGEALRQICQMLEPGGRLVLWVPAHPGLYSSFDRLIGHYRRYRLRELRCELESAGFSVEEIKYANAVGAFAWWLTARMLRRDPTRGPGVKVFDRTVVPVVRRFESAVRPPFGQSIFAVGATPVGPEKVGVA